MADNRVSPQNYYVVQGWMVSELGLKGNELAVYAIIYGFSQAEQQYYTGSAQYLADWIKSSKRTILTVLKSLVDKGCIEKRERTENGVKFCDYRCNSFATPVKKFHHSDEEFSPPPVKKFHHPGENFSPHNIADKIDDNISDKTDCDSSLSEQENQVAYLFCEVFGTDGVSNRFLNTIRNTLQAGVSPERMKSLIRSAKKHHPREPESYIAAGLKSLLKSAGQDKRVTLKPEEKPLADWEQDWLQEFKAMQHSTQT